MPFAPASPARHAHHPLDNPAWSALTSCHAHLAQGRGSARRYPDAIAPIGAVARAEREALDRLAALVPPGEWISLPATLDGLVPLVGALFTLRFATHLVQMVCARPPAPPAADVELVRLNEADVPEMLDLARLAQPGPFRTHTITFGLYVGVRVNGVLAAMGGQRMHLPGYREVSAICTRQEFRGRGFARAIVARLAAAILDEGLTPFLHVQQDNLAALALYRTLGFVERARLPLLVLDRPAGQSAAPNYSERHVN